MGPIRCSRCKAYINPFMRFIDQGKHFVCNLCGKGYRCKLSFISLLFNASLSCCRAYLLFLAASGNTFIQLCSYETLWVIEMFSRCYFFFLSVE
jgi:hypothetical protein